MGNLMMRLRGGDQALNAERRSMNEALAKLRNTKAAVSTLRSPARLILALDLTGSRAACLKEARIATASMLDAVKDVGRVMVKALYYRGITEVCETPGWSEDMDALSRQLGLLSCECGETQIKQVMERVLRETETMSGLIFIGDHCEEDGKELLDLATALGRKSVPMFIFHECSDRDDYALNTKPQFKRMAEASSGVYAEFKPDSGAALKEMLSTIAAFSTGGSASLKALPTPVTIAAKSLHSQLLLGSGTANTKGNLLR